MSKQFFLILVFSWLSLSPITSAQQACAEEKKLSGYCLEQESSGTGEKKVTVCAEAVRIDSPVAGWSCISKGPAWDVYVFRQDTKQYFKMPYNAWLKVNSMFLHDDRSSITKAVTESHSVDKGQKFVSYSFPGALWSDTSMLYQSDSNSEARVLRTEVRCLEWPVDIHPTSIIDKFYSLPPLKGMPLSITSTSGSSQIETHVRTKKMGKSDTISASQFVLPTGLQQIAFGDRIFFGQNAKGAIDDMFGATAK